MKGLKLTQSVQRDSESHSPGTRNFWMKIQREPINPAKASTNPTKSQALAPFLPIQPSV